MKHISKTLLHAFVCPLLFIGFSPLSLQAQEKLSQAAWRSDLQYFQQLIHSKYSNLFYNVTEKQFDSAVVAIDKKIGNLSDVQMNVEFTKLVAMFKIGHTGVSQRLGTADNLTPWVHPVPAKFYLFSDGLYIRSIDPKYKEAVGGRW